MNSMNHSGSHERRARVCIVAPVHAWDDVRVFQKQAITLAAAGYEVILLAQAPGRRISEGVEICNVLAPRVPRLLRFACLPAVLVQALGRRADIYHLHNPDTLPLCFALKLLGRRVIYDTHEDFSRRARIRTWIPRPLRRLAAVIVTAGERLAGRIADATIASQAGIARRLGARAIVLGNPPRTDPELLARVRAKAAAVAPADSHALHAVYVGLVNESRGLFEMVRAIEILNRKHAAHLLIVGPATPADLAKARSLAGWRHVEYRERVPYEDALACAAGADVGLAVVHDIADHAESDPNKLYEYMALGKPFIASSFPEWRGRLDGIDAGWLVPPGDPEAIAGALTAALDLSARRRKGQAGEEFARRNNWERESAKLVELYRRVLETPRN
jgi:glycosyltransferase involved in cell wall biosynthesis